MTLVMRATITAPVSKSIGLNFCMINLHQTKWLFIIFLDTIENKVPSEIEMPYRKRNFFTSSEGGKYINFLETRNVFRISEYRLKETTRFPLCRRRITAYRPPTSPVNRNAQKTPLAPNTPP